MSSHHTQELRRIFRAITILSPTSFQFAGQVINAPPVMAGQAGNHFQNPLIGQLQQQLYIHCYNRKFGGRLVTALPNVGDAAGNLTQALSEANASRERWEEGWQIQQSLPFGQVIAGKDTVTRALWPGEFITDDGPGLPPRVGASIRIFSARESRTMQPGFYFAFGETPAENQDVHDAVRFYWNIHEQAAVMLTQALTETLNRFLIPFRYKCSNHNALFYRVDSAILFVHKRYYRITAELLTAIYALVAPHMKPEVPLFTKRLAPGLAFAEEPRSGESFGMSRCGIVAEAIWQAYTNGEESESSRLGFVKNQFAGYGVSFETPYLESGSVDYYEFPDYRGE